MAEPLRDRFGREAPVAIANMLGVADSRFHRDRFLGLALADFDSLGLMDRVRQIARALVAALPTDYRQALECILRSLGPELETTRDFGMAPFLHLPFTFFIAERGLPHFDLSMRAQYELTKRCTCEFSIRPFLVQHPERTLDRLRSWSADVNPHVRRLVSEGTRPRLPWAPRLREFQRNPRPVLRLLELLKDDETEYVRRSVANNLNDIGKDNPEVLIATARKWAKNAPAGRMRVLRHALRSAVKRADNSALAILGFGDAQGIEVDCVAIRPARPRRGGSVRISLEVVNPTSGDRRVNVDLSVAFVKKSGRTRAKVFRMRSVTLQSNERAAIAKGISLADLTTRKHHPGRHDVAAIVNGAAIPIGAFTLV